MLASLPSSSKSKSTSKSKSKPVPKADPSKSATFGSGNRSEECKLRPVWPELPDRAGDWRCESWLNQIREERRNPYVLTHLSQGPSVRLLHQVLRYWMCQDGVNESFEAALPEVSNPNATFDANTEAIVRAFQTWHTGLKADGIVGHKTLKALDNYLGAPVDNTDGCQSPENPDIPEVDGCKCVSIRVSTDKPEPGYTFVEKVGGGTKMGPFIGPGRKNPHLTERFTFFGFRFRVDWKVIGDPKKCKYQQWIERTMFSTGRDILHTPFTGDFNDPSQGDATSQLGVKDFTWNKDGASYMDAPGDTQLLTKHFPAWDDVKIYDYCVDSDGTKHEAHATWVVEAPDKDTVTPTLDNLPATWP
jgi:hypothetical protein